MEETKLGRYQITYPDGKEYHTLKREIWGEDLYYFNSNNTAPFIIDIGAHIGVSVLYFKSIYPESRIVAFEPNPDSFSILEENIKINNITGITLVNKAVWNYSGIKDFYVPTDGYWSSNSSFSSGSWTSKEETKKISVETTTLSSYMFEDIDMMKIDTEGSEIQILKANRDLFKRIDNICVEYHPIKNTKPQDILNILNTSFNTEVYYEGEVCKKFPVNRLLTIKGKKSK